MRHVAPTIGKKESALRRVVSVDARQRALERL
jgi:hypothetical protein